MTPVADAPDARPINKPLVPADSKMNITMVIDVSGSMADPSGLPNLSRLDVQKAAINELLDQYDNRGDAMVQIVTFSSTAQTLGGGWIPISEAKTLIAGLTASGGTDYDAATRTGPGEVRQRRQVPDGKNVLYFLSDGQPQEGDNSIGIINGPGDPEVTNWENFLSANKVTAYALGIGSGLSAPNFPRSPMTARCRHRSIRSSSRISQLQDTLVAAGAEDPDRAIS